MNGDHYFSVWLEQARLVSSLLHDTRAMLPKTQNVRLITGAYNRFHGMVSITARFQLREKNNPLAWNCLNSTAVLS